MTSILDMMRTYNLIDFKFWIEIAAVLFVMTVGRDAFLGSCVAWPRGWLAIPKVPLAESDTSTKPHVVIIADPPEVQQAGMAQNQCRS